MDSFIEIYNKLINVYKANRSNSDKCVQFITQNQVFKFPRNKNTNKYVVKTMQTFSNWLQVSGPFLIVEPR